MCGINGIFSVNRIDNIVDRIENMNRSIIHRGPDAAGYKVFMNKVALGHRRLSIIDTKARANQPMMSNSKRWTIVFNGEIYNYLELKKEVSYDFKTYSDTEVILAYVEQFGFDEFIKKSNGMFAIALYDSKENKLFLARDRMGIKPLFYFLDNERRIIFSSEIKGILNSGLVKAEFNEEAIDDYLGYRYVREPNTFFKGIYQLESGTYLLIDGNFRIFKKQFWKLPSEFNMEKLYDEEDITQEFKNKIINSINRRLVADVPLGTYLSGGVDSSLISAITAKLIKDPINTYTIGFPEMNEFRYANLVAQRYNTIHHQIEINTDKYFETMDEVILYKDAPLSVPNEILLALMSKILKQKITVVLSGEGADELMGGYGRIFRAPFDYKNQKIKDKSFYEYFISNYEYVPRTLRDKYLKIQFSFRDRFDFEISKKFDGGSDEENVFRFFHEYHIKGLLQRLDTTTMLASVEARVPFLDHELIEYSYRNIPYDLKLHWKNEELKERAKATTASIYSEVNDTPKYLLRKIAYDYLPKEIIERKKVGFPVPLNNWIASLEMRSKEILTNAYWLKVDKIDELINESKNNNRAGQIIWMFINLEIFRKKYFFKEWRY